MTCKSNELPIPSNQPMKTPLVKLLLLLALIAGLILIPAPQAPAQTFTNLHSFTVGHSDGSDPQASLILSGDTLYGTTCSGGTTYAYDGTVFAINTNGTAFTNLYKFTATSSGDNPPYTNGDGANPCAGLVLSGNTLYGTASGGGISGSGTLFAISTNGTGFTNLHSFTTGAGSFPNLTNADGANPCAGLVLSGTTLYGTAEYGGNFSGGTVFAISTNGTGFTNLHSFTVRDNYGINSDGAFPSSGLILSGNTIYGTTEQGGNAGYGTVFSIKTNGTGFTNLHNFTATSGPGPYTNSDGARPSAGLVLSGNTLYGTATVGGIGGYGTMFALNTDGTDFTTLHSFTKEVYDSSSDAFTNSDGANPNAGLVLSGNMLYGTACFGGNSGNGTVFSLSLVQMAIQISGPNVILTWPTNSIGFTLHSVTNLASPTVWSPVSPAPIVVNGQCIVTNTISGAQKFYQLSH